jgi:thimet oligopeptidase
LAALAGAVLSLAGGLTPASAAAPRIVPLVVNWQLTPAQIKTSCAHELASARKRIDAMLLARSARTFDSIFVAYENIGDDLSDNLAAQLLMLNMSPDAAVRAASNACSNDVSTFGATESARPDLYAAMVAAAASKTARNAVDRKLEELALTAGQRAGAGLPAAKRRTFIALESKLAGLALKYNANLGNDASTITITPAQAVSLPADEVANFKKDASGNLIVPVNESTLDFQQNETDPAARQAFYMAYNRRGGMANVQLLQQALVARQQVAHLLGYANWSAYVASNRMARTPARIAAFLDNLDAALLPTAKHQFADLAALKGAPLDAWDISYYSNELRKTKYSVDAAAIKPYFPAQHTIDAVTAIYAKILGLRFTRVDNAPVWYKGVYAYDVNDAATGEYRGRFYLDLFPRPGKYDHFANVGPTARRVMPDGTIRPGVNIILGNWPAPAPGKPSLLSHDDVITFFHEFGHNMAALCANTPYESLNGPGGGGFRFDFTEAPSQMLENFVWDPTILKEISSNVDTGQRLPDDLIAKMIAARYVNEALGTTAQIFFATADQRYHILPQPIDTTAVWKATNAEFTPYPYVDGTYPQAAFGHLMSGYEGGYYGYLWSKVYAQDMFTAFKAGGLENPAVGARYRKEILAPSGSREPDASVAAFLGRPMSPDAFYTELGIAPPKEASTPTPR